MRRKNKEMEESGRMIVGRGEKIFRVVNNCFMVLLMLITLYPLLYVLFASLSDPVEFGKVTGLLWKPAGFSTRGYEAVLNSANIWLGFRNTIFYVVVGTACSMGITILGAYPLSRKGFLLKKPIMLFIIFTMFFSGGLVPTKDISPFRTLKNWGNSSRLVRRMKSPMPVFFRPSGRILFPMTRGSKSSLNIFPSPSLLSFINSAFRSSASRYMLRNLYILNRFPFFPTRS